MRNYLLSGISAFIIVAILFAIKCLIESKSLDIYISGAIVMGSIIAIGAFSISVIANWLKPIVHDQAFRFLIPAFIFGIVLGMSNLWMLSDSMKITNEVVFYQLTLFILVGLITSVVSFICAKSTQKTSSKIYP